MAIWQLMNLFFTIDRDTGKLSNPRKTPWSNYMQRFAGLPASARNARITSMIFTFFNTKMPAGLASDPRITQMSIKYSQKLSSQASRVETCKRNRLIPSSRSQPLSICYILASKIGRREFRKPRKIKRKLTMRTCSSEGQQKNIKCTIEYLSCIDGVIDAYPTC